MFLDSELKVSNERNSLLYSVASRGSAVFCLRAGPLFPWQGFYHRTRSFISMCFRLFPSSSRRSSVCRFVFPEQPRCLSTAQRCPWGLALEDAFRVTCRCGFVRGHGTSVRSACPRPQRALASVTSVCVIGLWADLSGCAWSVFLPHCCPACPSLRLCFCSLPRHNLCQLRLSEATASSVTADLSPGRACP